MLICVEILSHDQYATASAALMHCFGAGDSGFNFNTTYGLSIIATIISNIFSSLNHNLILLRTGEGSGLNQYSVLVLQYCNIFIFTKLIQEKSSDYFFFL